ncbi:MAG: hypothetical protein K9N46_06145 [Candidatus Marinimicrobia bacterium]|nr:hypothetical protein [Candidatus Neomarinimicrobiota bacterium]MCF7828559.1 hypothetical protein [Candidatus Neomarinimicrobiota bacterium]MCF7880300.1 hypothetical protein [Candidatus Neomarinimicrobiota bacterium]
MKKLLHLDYQHSWPVLSLLVLFQIFLTYIVLTTSIPVAAIFILGFVIVFPAVIYSPQIIFFSLLFYISLLPNQSWGEQYDLFPIYVNRFFVLALLFLAFAIFVIRNRFENRWKIRITPLDVLVGMFLLYSLVNLLWGLYNNANSYIAYTEFFYIFLYIVYYFVRYLLVEERWIIRFLWVMVIASTLASFEYIVLALTNLDLASFFINRVTTQQPHLAQLTIPILFGGILFIQNKWFKSLMAFLLIPNFLMAIFSQQRGLWGGILGALLFLIFLYYFRDKISFYRAVKFITGSAAFIFLLLLLVFAVEYYLNLSFLLTIYERLDSLANLALDRSLQIRVSEIKQAFSGWEEWIVFGEGLGATYDRIFVFRGSSGLDNTYAFILWKLGMFGLILFIAILGIYIWQSLKLYWMAQSNVQRMIIGALLAGMIGLLAIGMTNMSLIQYRFNIIWASFIALTQNLYIQARSLPND